MVISFYYTLPLHSLGSGLKRQGSRVILGGALKGSLGIALPPRPSNGPTLLFKTKIAHFATLFKTGDTTF